MTKTARPRIDFSLSSYETARKYASALVSRIHETRTNDALQAIEAGAKVDAYEILAVLPDAFSVIATRFGQSQDRREATKKARHLAHIANAVVQNHADGLPAYAEGDRSRAVEEAKQALAVAKDEIDALVADRRTQIEQVDILSAANAGLAEQVEDRETVIRRLQDILDYAKSNLDQRSLDRVTGYTDALEGL
jgi:hypothetical protein